MKNNKKNHRKSEIIGISKCFSVNVIIMNKTDLANLVKPL